MTDNKTDEIYVDPNSGAAPQPGGFAGLHAVELGHGAPGFSTFPAPEPEEAAEPQEFTEAEQVAYKATETQAAPSPDAENPEGEGLDAPDEPEEDSGQEFTEEEQVDFKATELQGAPPPDADGTDGAGGDYDPSKYGVEDVNAWLEQHPDQRDAVLKAEKAGKSRKGITGE